MVYIFVTMLEAICLNIFYMLLIQYKDFPYNVNLDKKDIFSSQPKVKIILFSAKLFYIFKNLTFKKIWLNL